MSRKVLGLLIGILCFSAPAYAETIEEFYRRFALEPTAEMLHPQGRYIVFVGDQMLAVSADDIIKTYREHKAMGVKSELLALEILSTKETGDIVSVAVRMRIAQTVGLQKSVLNAIGQEILLKKGDTYVSVFSLIRAEVN